ncbi:hypothetical protein ACWIEX_17305 [Bosea sp. NPDC055353]
MSEARRTYPRWTYTLEKALFHALFFALCGPVVAFLGYLLLSEVMSIPRVGFFPAVGQAAKAVQLLGTAYLVIAFAVIGPLMFTTGAVVAMISRYVRNEHALTALGFAVATAMTLAFSRITGVQEGSRLPLAWTGPLAICVSGLTGGLLTRLTRSLRRWSDRSTAASSEALQ